MKKEVKDLMGGKFRVITQVVCVLVLVLSLSTATAVSVMAADFPSISPTTAQYDLDDPAEVMTTVTWGIASNIVAVTDDEGNLTPGLYGDYIVLVKHLIILDTYLKGKLTDIGDSVELIIKFDVGAVTLTITAIGTQPSISPTTAQYDLDDPADVKTTVTWGIATSVASIADDEGHTLAGSQYTVTPITPGVSADVTIRSGAYLAGKLTDIGDDVVLTIRFNVGNLTTFAVTAIGTQPSISPTTGQYNIDSPADVKTTITWGTASSVGSIVDDDGHTLTGTEYTVTPITAGVSSSLTVRNSPYLAGKLTDIGDKVVLTIKFNLGDNATFEITATGVNAAVSPQSGQYDLDNPADVKTTITWGTASSVVSIADDDGHTLTGTEYTLTPVTPGVSANLTIQGSPYLAGKLTDIGADVVLTIKFDLGADATFTITAVGIQPKVSPQTKEYDLDNPANAATTVTWGTATAIVSVVDDDHYTLIKDTDYTVTAINADSATLTIRAEPYLEGRHMDIGDSVVLTIDFNFGANAAFTITSMGIQPSIFPVTADHDVIDRNDVTTTITWGSATSVVSIVDDKAYLLAEGMHYTVTPITPGVSANLTILSSTYLAGKLRSFGEKLVLTIGFDVGRDATLTITVPEVCFIATAAYGTPMAEEIQILREFRDEYLLTSPLGQALVDIYYRVSPPVAEFITEHPSLKPVVRTGLLPAVAMSAVAVNTTPVEKMVMVGLLVLVSVAVAVWVTRRRGRGPEYT
jgi:hypothetical protein